MKSFNIGLYVRVSTEEQAENPEGSIKNQEHRLREYVKLKEMVSPFGEIKEVFVDAGISAKDMNRPALQRLLGKISSGEINMILVTELSRFTRSIKDFSILKEFLQEHNCKFLSIKDNFDTSTAAGELVMYMMANIAEFERKQTAERISNAFLARAKRGLYNGGSVPMGYEIDPERSGHLRVVEEEAELVRLIFRFFLQEETLARTAKFLNAKGFTIPRRMIGGGQPRAAIVKLDMVRNTLRNKAYVGIRTYCNKDGATEETKACWPAIIDFNTFERAQKLLTKNRYRKRSHLNLRYPYTLSGILFCAECGHRMNGKSAHGNGGKIPYYEHTWLSKHQSSQTRKLKKCTVHRLQAKKIEPLVWKEVKAFLTDPKVMKKAFEIASQIKPADESQTEIDKLNRKLLTNKGQIEALAERIARLPKNVDERPILEQMAKLQKTKLNFENKLLELQNSARQFDTPVFPETFQQFAVSFGSKLKKADKQPELQAAVTRKVVHRIEICTNGFDIHFHVGQEHYGRELDKPPDRMGVARSCAKSKNPIFFKGNGSKSLKNGDPWGTRISDRSRGASQAVWPRSGAPA
jgi:site-specific DNA recombinase